MVEPPHLLPAPWTHAPAYMHRTLPREFSPALPFLSSRLGRLRSHNLVPVHSNSLAHPSQLHAGKRGLSGTMSRCESRSEVSATTRRASARIQRVPSRRGALVAEAKQIQSVLPWLRCLLLHCSLACVRREPWEGASGTCSLWTAALELSLWNLPPRPAPLFFSVPKAPRQAPSRHLQTLPGTFGLGPKRTFGLLLRRSLCVRRESGEGASGTCSPCAAALELSLWNLPPRPAPLFFRVPKATSRRLQKLPGAFGLLLRRSVACVRRERGEGASGTCSPCTAALEPSLWNLPPRPAPLFFRIPKATRQATSSILASNASGSLGREPLGPTVPPEAIWSLLYISSCSVLGPRPPPLVSTTELCPTSVVAFLAMLPCLTKKGSAAPGRSPYNRKRLS